MKILFLAANPPSTTRLNLGKELQEIEEGLRRSQLREKFQLVQRWAVRSRDLRRALLEENPDIVHFSGHGKGQAGLVIMDDAEQAKPATGQALAGLFSLFPNIKCVLLNACYAEAQAQAIVQKIDYVIGMRDTILDDAAIAFTTGFYDGLGYGRSIEDAFKLGQNAILWELASFSDVTRKLIPVELANNESSASLPEHLKPILLKKATLAKELKENKEREQNKVYRENYPDLRSNKLEQYRERVQEYVAKRILNPIANFQLATLAKELEISESEANKMWEEEVAQLRQQQAKFIPPSTPISRKKFLKWAGWGGGGLMTAVVVRQFVKEQSASIKEHPIPKPEQITPTEDNPNALVLPLQTFEFETVMVDAKGEVVKRDSYKQVKFFKENLSNGVTLDMVKIPGGSFMMGTEDEEIERLVKKFDKEWHTKEKPQHKVTLKPFFMGKYPVTQEQWKEIASLPRVNRDLNLDPSRFKGDDLPVEKVSWKDAVEFCARLSKQTGKKYRLSSEAEWEYACRARTTTPFYFGETITGELANYGASEIYANEPKGEYRAKTTLVGSFPASAFGLYDMHGNVFEWCEDNWHDNYNGAPTDGSSWISGNSSKKVIRGGSWNNFPRVCRSAYRNFDYPDAHYHNVGFRVVCVAPRQT